MSIGVQSYPELYTILLGWDLYGKLWDLLTQTGLAYLPFIGIILKNMGKTYVLHGAKGADHSLRGMEVNLLVTLLVIMFAASPALNLNAHTVSFTPTCGSDQGTAYHPGSTGTTYDKAFAIPDGDIKVPLWWYGVISISEGITSSANTMVGCVPNLRKMVSQVDMTRISDPELANELQDFETMCYAPARTQYFNDNRENNATHLNQIKQNVDNYGVEDTEWMGSHSFSNVYYRDLKATRPIPGFPYVPTEDINNDVNKASPPPYGTPSCDEWWNDSEHGLKNRVYHSLPKEFENEFSDYLKDESTQDSLVKRVIAGGTGLSGYANANNTIGDYGYSRLVSAVGILSHQMDEYPKLYAAAQAAPIIQSLLLLMTYVFLPFVLVFSGYAPRTIIAASIFIFSLIFWAFIWHLISWTDKSLMDALYTNWFAKQGAGATLTDMIIGSLVIGAPLFWFFLMGAMGIMASAAIGTITGDLSGIASAAAKSGSSAASNAAQAGAKAAATML
jgi:hypothetical protein